MKYEYMPGDKNQWGARLHEARLALAKGKTAGDAIADCYATAEMAVRNLERALDGDQHESWNESPASRHNRLAQNKARASALVGLPVFRARF